MAWPKQTKKKNQKTFLKCVCVGGGGEGGGAVLPEWHKRAKGGKKR